MRLPLFVGTRFQVLFHSPPGVLFTFPSRYSFTIGRQVVLSLGRWSSQLPPGFHVSQGTQDTRCPASDFVYGGVTLFAAAFQLLPLSSADPCAGPTTPTQIPGPVWARPLSLATTEGVSFDFLSYGYLDVSVPRVSPAFAVTTHDRRRVAPFGNLRVIARLPAHRSLSQAPTPFIAS